MKCFFSCFALLLVSCGVSAQAIDSFLHLKSAGNPAKKYQLNWQLVKKNKWQLVNRNLSNVDITVENKANHYTFQIVAKEQLNFNIQNFYQTSYEYVNSEFLLPGLWYKKNQRSSAGAPSIKEADSWSFREDRLSTPITAVYDVASQQGLSILRQDDIRKESLAVPGHGEMLLNSETDLGSLGFGQNDKGVYLQFGYPYTETPKTYVRKLTLAPKSMAFVTLAKGQTIILNYQLQQTKAADFAQFVKQSWQYSFDKLKPQIVANVLPTAEVKSTLSKFYKQSYINDNELIGFSGVHLKTAEPEKLNIMEVGFIGRVLLNAFNALQYGEQVNDATLVKMGYSVFDSYFNHGFNAQGFLRESTNFVHHNPDLENTLSIRRQSEGIYAALLFLDYQRRKGVSEVDWELKIQTLLTKLMSLQRDDGSFPRKFSPLSKIQDPSGGSSASAVLAYVMAHKYFKNEDYLDVARRIATYLETEIVSQSDYFSSTLDANSVDKEASFYTATAFYYLALVTQGKEQQSYIALADTANYFVMSWYYTWDVPFAKGQMLGDVGFKTRGWGNVSVENNHVDVFIFGYLDVLRWLSKLNNDKRLVDFANVIESSMKSQLLPRQGHMFNIGKEGYYPEVVQHTNWDYGHFGKGFYNDIFAPGWVVASLWEMLTPNRAEEFLKD
ncbi:hypothetical protein QX776_10295 [Alteromonadaceae bacterium BrNp21-10]|nr:hypothetical protein [Alteromonadaceae bacterium BrNp21-10]